MVQQLPERIRTSQALTAAPLSSPAHPGPVSIAHATSDVHHERQQLMTSSTSTAPSRNKTAPAFASASNPSSADQLLGRLVAYRPIEVRSVETKLGASEATFCQLLDIAPDGTAIDLGERPIFWQVVRQQLAKATEQVPWIAGRLVQSGQAYRLDALGPSDEPAVTTALAALAG